MRLHLGCGANVLDGWVNIDIGVDDERVICGDVASLDDVVHDGGVSEIYACHVFEHIPRARHLPVLRHWFAKLQTGGSCRISVPDFNYLVREYLRALGNSQPWWETGVIRPLFGGYDEGGHGEHNHHQSAFDFRHLEHLMRSVGFVGVRRYDPSELGFDPQDWSTQPLSLNVVGFRPSLEDVASLEDILAANGARDIMLDSDATPPDVRPVERAPEVSPDARVKLLAEREAFVRAWQKREDVFARECKEREEQVRAAYEESMSWRVTRGLRALRRLLP